MTTPESTMTVTGTTTRPRPSILLRVTAALATLLGIIDIAFAAPYIGDPMPVEVGVGVIALGVLTVVGAIIVFARRPWGAWVAAVTRILAIGAMVPILVEPDAPAEAVAPAIILIILTVVVVAGLIVGVLRGRPTQA